MTAPVDVSPNTTSFTIWLSSTTVPHCVQKLLPAAASLSIVVPPHSVHIAWMIVDQYGWGVRLGRNRRTMIVRVKRYVGSFVRYFTVSFIQ